MDQVNLLVEEGDLAAVALEDLLLAAVAASQDAHATALELDQHPCIRDESRWNDQQPITWMRGVEDGVDEKIGRQKPRNRILDPSASCKSSSERWLLRGRLADAKLQTSPLDEIEKASGAHAGSVVEGRCELGFLHGNRKRPLPSTLVPSQRVGLGLLKEGENAGVDLACHSQPGRRIPPDVQC